MRKLKLFVTFLFILSAVIFFGQPFFTAPSSAKNATFSATLSAPTGVSASDGDYIDKISVMWDTVRGATVYRVFRNTVNDSSTANDVGTTAANYFFDTTAQINQNYFYWVRAENTGGNSILSNSDAGLRVTGSFNNQIFSPLNPPPAPNGNAVTAAKASLGKTLFGTSNFLQLGRFLAGLVIVLRRAVLIRGQIQTPEIPALTMFLTRRTMFSVRPAFRRIMRTELTHHQISLDLMNRLRRENHLLI